MYPLLRFITVIIKALTSKPLAADAICETTLRCMPWDIDLFLELNNGRVLTLYDLGRFDLAIRTGLARLLRRKRWGLVVAGGSVRYRRRVRMFDKITIRTQMVGAEERWIYIAQSMWVKGEPTSSILLRTGITGKGKAIPIAELRAEIPVQNWIPEMPEWVNAWRASDELRPWPPQP